MKTLIVPFRCVDESQEDAVSLQAINIEPWSENLHPSCEALFSISHFNRGICIKYTVIEQFLSARKRDINGEVHRDNCVEFFIAFGDEAIYYNFEFNCLGSIKAAYGMDRHNRHPLSPADLAKLYDKMEISIDNTVEVNKIWWSLKVILPLDIFVHHRKQTLSGLTCTANFTKCGDDLPNPHFLSWVALNSAEPNFHQPLSFGKLIFE